MFGNVISGSMCPWAFLLGFDFLDHPILVETFYMFVIRFTFAWI